MDLPGLRKCVRRKEIQNAELQNSERKCSLQGRFSIPIRTFGDSVSETPRSKRLAPDGSPCSAETKGLLKRAHIVAGEIRYVGKETDRRWEEGEEISVLEFTATEYGRKGKVIATEEVKAAIQKIGINKCARESGFHRANFIRKLIRDLPVKRNSYTEFLRWLDGYNTAAQAGSSQ